MCYGVLCLQLRIILSWFYLFYLVMLIVQGQTDIWLKSGGVDVCISCWGLWGIKTEIKKRNKIIASDLKGFAVLFIFSLFLIHWNITFLENVSCFLIFDGNLTPNRNSSFHHSLNFCYGFLFSMCHFLKELKKFFFFLHWLACGILVLQPAFQGSNLGPLQNVEAWKHDILALPGEFLHVPFFTSFFLVSLSPHRCFLIVIPGMGTVSDFLLYSS